MVNWFHQANVKQKQKGIEMDFSQFKKLLNKNIDDFLNTGHFFKSSVPGDVIWETYLDSFPPGTNEIVKERREYDDSCCRNFVKNFGGIVKVENGKLVSIWSGMNLQDGVFESVCKTLANLVENADIENIYLTNNRSFGSKRTYDEGRDKFWEHFYIDVPASLRNNTNQTLDTILGQTRTTFEVFKRGMEEFTTDTIEMVLELCEQNSIYRGRQFVDDLKQFLTLKVSYDKLQTRHKKDLFLWENSRLVNNRVTRLRNISIGTLLIDVSDGIDIESAVRKFEVSVMAPENYQRPTTLVTPSMKKKALEFAQEHGWIDSLYRRHAVVDDLNISDILFANADATTRMTGNPFDAIPTSNKHQDFSKVQEISIEDFIRKVLPTATAIEAYVENRHANNFVSIVAPQDSDAKSLLKWNNNFGWVYEGNLTDSSMRENVKKAGGRVDGVMRFSIQWNEDDDNRFDFDAHAKEPNGNHIYFWNKNIVQGSSGMLDVDIMRPKGIAVENIIWTDSHRMPSGQYLLSVSNYSNNRSRKGFTAEVEVNGEVYEFVHDKPLQGKEVVPVAVVNHRYGKFEVRLQQAGNYTPKINSRKIWGIDTNQFVPVTVMMFSPNFWGENKIGNKHYMFMLDKCLNPNPISGFFNEFLHPDFHEHRKTFGMLAEYMRVPESAEQLSGLGFSETIPNELVVKVQGKTNRILKIKF